jgi:hypothetical protein
METAVVAMLALLVGLTVGAITGRIKWTRRVAGQIMVGEEDGEPKLNLVLYAKYADNIEAYDFVELEVKKYDPQFIQSLK